MQETDQVENILGSDDIGVSISDYQCVGDDMFYDYHVFTVKVWNEKEKLFYSLQRSYTSFCLFHVKVMKKYPKTDLPSMPLTAFARFQKHSMRLKCAADGTLQKKTFLGSTSASTEEKKLRRKDTIEVISQRKPALTTYMQELLQLPELLISEDLTIFLDEESPDGLKLKIGNHTSLQISQVLTNGSPL